jgi:hypothetical protein
MQGTIPLKTSGNKKPKTVSGILAVFLPLMKQIYFAIGIIHTEIYAHSHPSVKI